jgi:hypothetical protein
LKGFWVKGRTLELWNHQKRHNLDFRQKDIKVIEFQSSKVLSLTQSSPRCWDREKEACKKHLKGFWAKGRTLELWNFGTWRAK